MVGNKFVIRGHHPVRNFVLTVVLVLLVVASVAAAHWYGGRRSASELTTLRATVSEQRMQLDALEHANRELRERLAVVERSAQVDRESANSTREALAEQTKSIAKLESDLGIYRSILSEDNTSNRLRVHQVLLEKAGPDGAEAVTFGFEIILTRFFDAREPIEGSVTLVVREASTGDSSQPLRLKQISTPFRLKHMQAVRGQIELPGDFIPEGVSVQATAEHKQRTLRAQRSFDWPEVSAG